MFTFHPSPLLAVALLGALCGQAAATPPYTTSTAVVTKPKSVLVVPQYAVPVGVPVAPVAQAWYAMQPQAAQPAQIDPQSDRLDRIEAALEALVRLQGGGVVRPLRERTADVVVEERCVACHQPGDAKGGLDLTVGLDALDPVVRKRILFRISTPDDQKRMPKGRPALDSADQELLLDSFLGVRETSSLAPPETPAPTPAPAPPQALNRWEALRYGLGMQ